MWVHEQQLSAFFELGVCLQATPSIQIVFGF
jgi:hypothetical protein